MNEERILQVLAGASRADAPPAVDVADRVLASLRAARRPARLVVWFATAASAAAIVIVVMALWSLTSGAKPMTDASDMGLIGML